MNPNQLPQKDRKNYKIVVLQIQNTGGSIPVGGSDVTFTNYGNLAALAAGTPSGSTLYVNSIPIIPGTQLIITADDPLATDTTTWKFRWDDTTGTDRNGQIIRKIYPFQEAK